MVIQKQNFFAASEFIEKIRVSCTEIPRDRSLVRNESQGTNYWLAAERKKYHVLNQNVINDMAGISGWGNICDYPASILDGYSQGPNFIDTGVGSNDLLVQLSGDAKVYLIKNGEKRWISSETVFNDLGYDWSDIITTSNNIFVNNSFIDGAVVAATSNFTLEELNELFSYDWDIVDRESIYAIVKNCIDDPEYTYTIWEYKPKIILGKEIPYFKINQGITPHTNAWIRGNHSTTNNPISVINYQQYLVLSTKK